MRPLVNEVTVDLIRKNPRTRGPQQLREPAEALAILNPACGIARGVQNHEPRARRQMIRNEIQIEAKAVRLAQGIRDRLAPRKSDHGLVYGKARIGVERFIPLFDRAKNGVKHDRLRARSHDHLLGR